MHVYKIDLKQPSTNTSFCKMAATGAVKPNEELNVIFKSLAERGKNGETFKKYNDFLTSLFLPQLSSKSNKSEFDHNNIKFWAYGSAAEDLQLYEPNDVGDIDFMIFPNSDKLMIHEEMLEYSLENPLHVRIKGGDNLALQSCLVAGTEYVATSALKSFHPAIFGPRAPLLVDSLSLLCQMVGQVFRSIAHLKNSPTSPAVSLYMSHWTEAISKFSEMLTTDPQNFPVNEAAAEMECIVHFLSVVNGTEYTREHAELLNDFLSTIKDTLPACQLCKSLPHFVFTYVPQFFDRCVKLIPRLDSIETRSLNKTVHNNDQQVVPSEQRDRKESGVNAINLSRATDKENPRITAQNCDVKQKSPKNLETTSSPSTTQKDSKGNSQMLSEKLFCKEITERGGVQCICNKNEKSGEYNEDENSSKAKRQSLTQTEELTSKDLSSNPDGKDDDEKNELIRRYRRWGENIFRTLTEELETKFKVTEQVENGFDFIPAFRSRGWPKVAREWIQRERKWPCPEIVDKVIQEGFHLVVKPPKNNGNPKCDFRISFSHAEYLLSQEMNDIQRECYRCFKRYHRAYLSTQPKSLVSFHLKNIFLQTIEETGTEMWTESNRAECMMKLLGNLLKALTKKDLRHFFVRSYNLLGADYIENPAILESLADKVKEILENPVEISKQLLKSQEETKYVKTEESVSEKRIPKKKSSPAGKSAAAGQSQWETDEIPSKGSCDTQSRKENVTDSFRPTEAAQKCCPVYRYHELHDVYWEVTKQLVHVAFDAADWKLDAMDPLERSVAEDLRELVRKYGIPVSEFPRVFNAFWHKRAYYWVWIRTEPDIRHRVLVAVQGAVEILKYHLKEGDFWQAENDQTIEAFVDKMLDQSEEKLSDMLPSGSFIQFLHKVASMSRQLNHSHVGFKSSSVVDLRELVKKYFDITCTGPPKEILDLFLDTFFRFLVRDAPDSILANMQILAQFSMRDALEDEVNGDLRDRLFDLFIRFSNSFTASSDQPEVVNNREAKNDDALVDSPDESDDKFDDMFDSFLELFNSFLARAAQQRVVNDTDDIPLD